MKVSELKPNPNNPRVLKDDKFNKLVKSITEFPKMMSIRPIVVDQDNMILGGNMRLRAIQSIGMKEIPDTWVKRADELTEEEKKRFIISDNVGFGEWDWEALSEWDIEQLQGWGMDLPSFNDTETDNKSLNIKSRFVIEVECNNENEQEKIYNEMIERGFVCKVLTL